MLSDDLFILTLAGVATALGCADKPSTTSPDAGEDVAFTEDSANGCIVDNPVSLDDARGVITVSTTLTGTDCDRRTYRIESTAQRRDQQPSNPRVLPELADWPSLRSGNVLFDGLYAMALEEVRENSVESISDGAFAGGAPIACASGGCFETGAEWHYVWTRDISYATDLGLADLDAARAKNSLMFKVSERRGGGDIQVMQDTGTGGGYPTSTDRVVWALGALAVVAQLPEVEAQAFASDALDVLLNTMRHDREVVFEESVNRYRGEQSFLDWREQSYPAFVAGNPALIASSHALSTNLLHLRAMQIAQQLADYTGRSSEATMLTQWRAALLDGIQRFWVEDHGLYSTFLMASAGTGPGAGQFDLLGSALSVLFDVATQPTSVLQNYPHYGVGAPVIFPQQQFTPIYHNRAEWPFVSAYWLRAAAVAGNDKVAARMFESLIRGAGLNLSNMENFEAASGEPWVDDGEYSGPVVNSRRQLWSVAGYVSMVHQTLFGLQPSVDNGPELHIRPAVPRAIRGSYFEDSDRLTLRGFRYRGMTLDVVLNLPEDSGGDGIYEVASILVDGQEQLGSGVSASSLSPGSVIEVNLRLPQATTPSEITIVDDADWRAVFAPRPPVIDDVRREGDEMVLDFSSLDEAADIVWTVWSNGESVATDLAGTTGSARFALPPGTEGEPRCFSVEACFGATGNCSHRSEQRCWWGDNEERVARIAAGSLQNVGGLLSDEHGRSHWSQWGDPGHQLSASGLSAGGTRLELALVYGNGAGPIATGVTCGVKRVVVTDESDGTIVIDQFVVLPHLGDWAQWSSSTPVRANGFDSSHTYRIDVIADDEVAVNMSVFQHFVDYTGLTDAPFNRVNVAELVLGWSN